MGGKGSGRFKALKIVCDFCGKLKPTEIVEKQDDKNICLSCKYPVRC